MRSLTFPFAALLAAAALAGCGQSSGPAAMPMAQLPVFDQPAPRAPLLADSNPQPTPHYPVRIAAAQSLPAAVPVPPRAVIAPDGAKDDHQPDGGSSPAAGYAGGITDARGDGSKHELDGSK
ncbi:hypothetical protein [Pantoea sp. 18069]|uniref:hypothetical protein n=1 Tax=Pantoea sp. 18069 TaxID=2681415 RepID=UPI00135B290F|nr:hypothetical protein [Pantoea sp. 18069]